MVTFDTEENGRTAFTRETLKSLFRTVDFSRHRLVVVDNGSIKATLDLLKSYCQYVQPFTIIYNDKNIGTAKAINKAWRLREPGEHAVKMDNDCVIRQCEWADWMEDAFNRESTLGILGLKRRDLMENPFDGTSVLRMLPHIKGQRWITIEEVAHVMGTCQGYSSNLLDKIGYLVQPGVYGFDDALSSLRSRLCHFANAFLVGFEIDHIDPGGSPHGKWKIAKANEAWDEFRHIAAEYEMGIRPIYEGNPYV